MSAPYIPFHRCSVTEDEINSVCDVLRSGWLTTGNEARLFEQEFCQYTGASAALAVNSCTAALHLSLVAHGIGPGDEVITTPLTFCSTVSVIEHVGATPVLADINAVTGNISPEAVASAVTRATRAIIPVHYAGMPCALPELQQVAHNHNLLLIEDSAHAMGTFVSGTHVGIHNAGAFSFYATKNVSTGEGGMLASPDAGFIDRCRKLSLHGMSRDAWRRYEKSGSWYYEVEYPGYKYNLPDILAALGRKQLSRLPLMNRRRQEIATQYIRKFRECQWLEPFQFDITDEVVHPRHLFPVLLSLDSLKSDRAEIILQLANSGIGCSVHFIPIHYHPYYRDTYGWKTGDFPVAERFYEREISLPIYPDLSDNEVERVADTLLTVLKHNAV